MSACFSATFPNELSEIALFAVVFIFFLVDLMIRLPEFWALASASCANFLASSFCCFN